MNEKVIITIGREYGSGGRKIGEELAKRLGIVCYDKNMLQQLAKQSGFCEEIIHEYDEKPTNSLLYSLAVNPYGVMNSLKERQPLETRVYLSMVELIRKLAKEQSCIIIGRSADYILKDEKNVWNFFVCADMEKRVERIMKVETVSKAHAETMIAKTDKNRAQFYQYYTEQKWGDVRNYHMCVNSSVYGIEGTADVLLDFINKKEFVKKA